MAAGTTRSDRPMTQRPTLEYAVFSALADPTRRAIFERLCDEPQPVGVLAAGMPVSRPAVSQHLRTLKEAGLVTETRHGTSRTYSARVEGLEALRAWVERHWDVVLTRFAEAAATAEREAVQAETDSEKPRD